MLAAFSLATLDRSVRGHWILPGAVSLYLLVGSVVCRGGRLGRILIGGTAVVSLLGALAVAGALLAWGRVETWGNLAREVERLKPDFVIAQDYHEAAQMAYHLRPRAAVDFTAVGWGGKSFRNWWSPAGFEGKDAVIVYEQKDFPEGIELVRKCFDRIDEPVEVKIPRFMASEPEPFVLLRARSYRPPR